MSILQQIAEGTALLEVSKQLLSRYVSKAKISADHHDGEEARNRDHMYGAAETKEPELHDKFSDKAMKHNKKLNNRLDGMQRANKKLAKEEIEQVDELSKNTLKSYVSKTPNIRGAQLARDKVKGHPDARVHAKEEVEQIDEISDRATARYLSKAVGSLEHAAGTGDNKTRKKRFNGIYQIARNMYSGKPGVKKLTKEEVELEEGNAANKEKKNAFVAKKGAEQLHIDGHDEANFRVSLKADSAGSSKAHATKAVVGAMKKYGRQELKNPTKHDGAYHADYDKKAGVYHIKHRESGKIVDHNVANSGGAALAAADRWNKKSIKEEAVEEGHKRGRPRKARHEDGKIVNDADANDTRPAN